MQLWGSSIAELIEIAGFFVVPVRGTGLCMGAGLPGNAREASVITGNCRVIPAEEARPGRRRRDAREDGQARAGVCR